jgi:hypothetical protein
VSGLGFHRLMLEEGIHVTGAFGPYALWIDALHQSKRKRPAGNTVDIFFSLRTNTIFISNFATSN